MIKIYVNLICVNELFHWTLFLYVHEVLLKTLNVATDQIITKDMGFKLGRVPPQKL